MFRDTDRDPKEARKILVLMFLRVFWQQNFMRIELPVFHKAFGVLLGEVRKGLRLDGKNPREVTDLGFVLDDSLTTFPMLDRMLQGFEDLGILAIERGGQVQAIVFNASTRRLVMKALVEELGVTADENNFLLPLCDAAARRYHEIVRELSCD